MSNELNGTLYILGNGFDCCHGLNTSPDKFLEFLKNQEVYNETETAEIVFARYNVLWGDYESCLADIDLEEIADNQIIAPDYLSDHEYDRDSGIFNIEHYTESLWLAVQNSLKAMVDSANKELEYKNPLLKCFVKKRDAVLTFNYTSTLEKLYDIPNEVPVCHIHGFYEKGEPLLLGYRDGMSDEVYFDKFFDEKTFEEVQNKIEEIQMDVTLTEQEKARDLLYWYAVLDEVTGNRDYYIDTQREIVFQFYQALKKEMQIKRLKKFLGCCSEIKHVVVMGHSMSSVDSDYMELIEEILAPEEWRISQYNDDPAWESVCHYSFAGKISFFNLIEEYGR